MAAHKVTFKLNSVELGLLDSAEFIIRANGKKLGTVRISRNALFYTPSVGPRRKIAGYWDQFDKLMKKWDHGKRTGKPLK